MRERERMRITKIYIMLREYTIVARRLKTGVESIWFEIVFSGVLLKFLECSKEIWNINFL